MECPASKELEDALKRQVWSIKRRRLLKEGKELGGQYRSAALAQRSGNVDRGELFIDEGEAVIDEEGSAEASLQDLRYSEKLSGAASELKISDDELEEEMARQKSKHTVENLRIEEP